MTLGTALTAGYSATQLLDFLMNNFPNIGDKIKEAKKVGYDVNKIVDMFKSMTSDEVEKYEHSDIIRNGNPWIDADETFKKRNAYNALSKGALKVGKGIGMAAAPLAAYTAFRALKPGIQPLVQAGIDYLGKQLQTPGEEIAEGVEQPVQDSLQPGLQQDVPIAPTLPTVTSEDPIAKYGLENKVGSMLRAGNAPESIAASLLTFVNPGLRRDYIKGVKEGNIEPFESAITKYLSEKVKPEKPTEVPADTQPPIEPQKISKGSEVLTPTGLGKIKSETTKNVLIDEDGKTKQFKRDQITSLPLPEKDMAQLYEDLIGGIEKETQQPFSRHVSMVGYEPDHNELMYRAQDGATYIFDDISESKIEDLLNVIPRKTTGENYIGTWLEGSESPIGAAMSKLLIGFRKEGKEHIRKYKTVFDVIAPAKEALKTKHKKLKDEERTKKKEVKTEEDIIQSKVDKLSNQLDKHSDIMSAYEEKTFRKIDQSKINTEKRVKEMNKFEKMQEKNKKIADDLYNNEIILFNLKKKKKT